jgi:hypothetical protein
MIAPAGEKNAVILQLKKTGILTLKLKARIFQHGACNPAVLDDPDRPTRGAGAGAATLDGKPHRCLRRVKY